MGGVVHVIPHVFSRTKMRTLSCSVSFVLLFFLKTTNHMQDPRVSEKPKKKVLPYVTGATKP